MRYDELLLLAPALREYASSVPPQIDGHFTLKSYGARQVIHYKDSHLHRIGILLSGKFRVINEFENGNIFMIEVNEPISFVGEVTLLARAPQTSVTIETITECDIAFLPADEFDLWLQWDVAFLREVSAHVAKKLYSSSYNRGERLFYSSAYLLLKYILTAIPEGHFSAHERFTLHKTRPLISEEIGMTLKTVNRTVTTLSQDCLITLTRGKIELSQAQYAAGLAQMDKYLRRSKNGAAAE